jgi:hypothetical protein
MSLVHYHQHERCAVPRLSLVRVLSLHIYDWCDPCGNGHCQIIQHTEPNLHTSQIPLEEGFTTRVNTPSAKRATPLGSVSIFNCICDC